MCYESQLLLNSTTFKCGSILLVVSLAALSQGCTREVTSHSSDSISGCYTIVSENEEAFGGCYELGREFMDDCRNDADAPTAIFAKEINTNECSGTDLNGEEASLCRAAILAGKSGESVAITYDEFGTWFNSGLTCAQLFGRGIPD